MLIEDNFMDRIKEAMSRGFKTDDTELKQANKQESYHFDNNHHMHDSFMDNIRAALHKGFKED